MSKNVRRRGFTLPEVLVTITIVAVLAAVVVPAVLNQVGKGDNSAVAQDLIAVRTAITTFTSDTRRFPGNLRDLSGDTLNPTNNDIDGSDYGTDAKAAYNGPYVNIGLSHASPGGVRFSNAFKKVGNQVCLSDSTPSALVGPVSEAKAMQLERALETQPDSTSGVVRWIPSTSTDSIESGTLRVCLVNK